MKLIWTPRSQRRLQEIHDHIAQDQPAHALQWVARILDRSDQMGEHPRSGRIVPEYQRDTIREIFEGDYRIIYRIRSQQVDVLTVRHGARLLPGATRQL